MQYKNGMLLGKAIAQQAKFKSKMLQNKPVETFLMTDMKYMMQDRARNMPLVLSLSPLCQRRLNFVLSPTIQTQKSVPVAS